LFFIFLKNLNKGIQ
jgi:hypothetical protein